MAKGDRKYKKLPKAPKASAALQVHENYQRRLSDTVAENRRIAQANKKRANAAQATKKKVSTARTEMAKLR